MLTVVFTVTETVLAVRIASMRRQEQNARNPLMLPAKATPPAQVMPPTGQTQE